MSNPYELMWQTLTRRLEQGKTGWGKLELQATMKEVEIGVWRNNYTPSSYEDEAHEAEEIADYVDMMLRCQQLGTPLDLDDLDELVDILNREEEKHSG